MTTNRRRSSTNQMLQLFTNPLSVRVLNDGVALDTQAGSISFRLSNVEKNLKSIANMTIATFGLGYAVVNATAQNVEHLFNFIYKNQDEEADCTLAISNFSNEGYDMQQFSTYVYGQLMNGTCGTVIQSVAKNASFCIGWEEGNAANFVMTTDPTTHPMIALNAVSPDGISVCSFVQPLAICIDGILKNSDEMLHPDNGSSAYIATGAIATVAVSGILLGIYGIHKQLTKKNTETAELREDTALLSSTLSRPSLV